MHHTLPLLLTGLAFVSAAQSGEPSQFSELPPDLPLPSSVIRGQTWTKNAIVIQPWGYTQPQMMRLDATDLPTRLRDRYGFNVLCVMPPTALEAVGGGKQTEQNFTNALARYRAAGYKIILYSSVVNVGHDPAWYQTLKEHSDWRQIDALGTTKNWLCPNTGAFEEALEYTKGIIARYGADGIMLDNNAFMGTASDTPACYCNGCRVTFSEYVGKRFGRDCLRYFGIAANDVQIPRTKGPLYNLWKKWRNRTWVEAMERARQALPDVVLLANTQYGYWTSGTQGWFLAHDQLYPHEDMVLSESYFMEPQAVSSKMILGRALAGSLSLFDLVGTFEWKPPKFAPLKPGPLVRRLTAAALMHNAQPWLGYYGMEEEQGANKDGAEALSQLLLFRSRHPEFYTDVKEWSSLCSILPLGTYTMLGTEYPVVPRHLKALTEAGATSAGVVDLWLREENLSPFKLTIAENVACCDKAVEPLVNWIRQGGTLITTADLGTVDEIGRARPISKLAEALKIKALTTSRAGKGKIWVLPREQLAGKALELGAERVQVANVTPGTVEIRPYVTKSQSLILHVTDYGEALQQSWELKLPDSIVSRFDRLILHRPADAVASAPRAVRASVNFPPIETYAVIELIPPPVR